MTIRGRLGGQGKPNNVDALVVIDPVNRPAASISVEHGQLGPNRGWFYHGPGRRDDHFGRATFQFNSNLTLNNGTVTAPRRTPKETSLAFPNSRGRDLRRHDYDQCRRDQFHGHVLKHGFRSDDRHRGDTRKYWAVHRRDAGIRIADTAHLERALFGHRSPAAATHSGKFILLVHHGRRLSPRGQRASVPTAYSVLSTMDSNHATSVYVSGSGVLYLFLDQRRDFPSPTRILPPAGFPVGQVTASTDARQ